MRPRAYLTISTILTALAATGLALPAAGASEAHTERWDLASIRASDPGGPVVGAGFEGLEVLGGLTVPYFTLDGVRHDLSVRDQVEPPRVLREGGGLVVETAYRVPTESRPVTVRIRHRFVDHDARYSDLGVFGSEVAFEGPAGVYRFFWRVDLDLDGPEGDRVQVFAPAGRRGYWSATGGEQVVELPAGCAGDAARAGCPVVEFGRYLVRLIDGPDHAHQVQVRLGLPDHGRATVFVVRNRAEEATADPVELVDGEVIQRVSHGEPIPQPVAGSDLVLWYRAEQTGSRGLLGPTFHVARLSGRQAVIELDRMESTQYPPETSVLQGETISIESAFAKAGVTINRIIKDGVIPDAHNLSIAELDATMETHMTHQEEEDTPTQWYSWFGLVHSLYAPGVLGIMADYYEYSSDEAYREGAFAFYDAVVEYAYLFSLLGFPPQDPGQWLMMTVAHETGHAYNQHHEDYWIVPESCFYQDSSIMGYSFDVTNHLYWDFGPNSDASMRGGDPDEYVRPGHGVDFVADSPRPYPYNTTVAHQRGHHWTGEFSGGGCMFGLESLLETEDVNADARWSLEISTTRSRFLLGEPVAVQVALTNVGPSPARAAPLLQPAYQAARYWITRPDGSRSVFHPTERFLAVTPALIQTFAPGDRVEDEVDLFADRHGWTFDRPGRYEIQVEFTGNHPDSTLVASNPLTIVIEPVEGQAARAAERLTRGEAVLLLLWGRGDHLTHGIETLRMVTREFPDTVHALLAHEALGAAAARPFFNGTSTRPPRYDEAVAHLEPVFQALERQRIITPSVRFAAETCALLADALDALGQTARAAAVRQAFVARYEGLPGAAQAIGAMRARLSGASTHTR